MLGAMSMFGGLWFVYLLVYVGVTIYVIWLFKRLVEAVERIAARGDGRGPGL